MPPFGAMSDDYEAESQDGLLEHFHRLSADGNLEYWMQRCATHAIAQHLP